MISALLFDLDGTLCNTDPTHFQTWVELLRDYGMEIDEAFYQSRITGRMNEAIIQDLLPQLSPSEGKQLADEKEARFRKLALKLERLAGVSNILAWSEERELLRSLVTNAPPKNVEFMLQVLGLTEMFESVILAENLPAGKPDPLPYRMALEKLGISASEAVAFEDSPSGIRSAVGAGIYTIGIASTQSPQHLKDLGASMAVSDFTDPELWKLLETI
ncbi:HAD family phosphatase [Oscillatoria sp. HE19RPO]|uniref:HAD family hydrolase n=1 Tax=Oscillatoria sp. HE19RPO TaxID=2954806 RepID=UPI0020C1D35D|nr:HAD-IA family hydrolase [Oscillatoria sp. HE19RPO]